MYTTNRVYFEELKSGNPGAGVRSITFHNCRCVLIIEKLYRFHGTKTKHVIYYVLSSTYLQNEEKNIKIKISNDVACARTRNEMGQKVAADRSMRSRRVMPKVTPDARNAGVPRCAQSRRPQ